MAAAGLPSLLMLGPLSRERLGCPCRCSSILAEDGHGFDKKRPAPLRASHPRTGSAGHACPLGAHDGCHRFARVDRPDRGRPTGRALWLGTGCRRTRHRTRRSGAAAWAGGGPCWIGRCRSSLGAPSRGCHSCRLRVAIGGFGPWRRTREYDACKNPYCPASVRALPPLQGLATDLNQYPSLFLVWRIATPAGRDPVAIQGQIVFFMAARVLQQLQRQVGPDKKECFQVQLDFRLHGGG
jgi:hypothetical protein